MMIGIVNSISFIDSLTDTFSGVILQMAFSCEMHHEIRKWKSGMQECDHDDVSRRTTYLSKPYRGEMRNAKSVGSRRAGNLRLMRLPKITHTHIHIMNKLPTVKSIINTRSIFGEYTFEDLVTFGRVSAKDATITCMINAQKDYMKAHPIGFSDGKNLKDFATAWKKLEAQVLRKFKEAEEIASIL